MFAQILNGFSMIALFVLFVWMIAFIAYAASHIKDR